jgi:hypothetical protein
LEWIPSILEQEREPCTHGGACRCCSAVAVLDPVDGHYSNPCKSKRVGGALTHRETNANASLFKVPGAKFLRHFSTSVYISEMTNNHLV